MGYYTNNPGRMDDIICAGFFGLYRLETALHLARIFSARNFTGKLDGPPNQTRAYAKWDPF